MTKKDFFSLLIKIFGLYSLISFIFSVLPVNFIFVIQYIDAAAIAWIILILIVTFLIFLFLIYNPNRIINWLKLDKGFDDDRIDFLKFNNTNILKLAVIIIGGVLLIQNVPRFLSFTLFAFKSSIGKELNTVNFGGLRDYIHWGTSFINILIGYLMLTNYNFISRILKEKNKEEAPRD
jgi:hypothetical protein